MDIIKDSYYNNIATLDISKITTSQKNEYYDLSKDEYNLFIKLKNKTGPIENKDIFQIANPNIENLNYKTDSLEVNDKITRSLYRNLKKVLNPTQNVSGEIEETGNKEGKSTSSEQNQEEYTLIEKAKRYPIAYLQLATKFLADWALLKYIARYESFKEPQLPEGSEDFQRLHQITIILFRYYQKYRFDTYSQYRLHNMFNFFQSHMFQKIENFDSYGNALNQLSRPTNTPEINEIMLFAEGLRTTRHVLFLRGRQIAKEISIRNNHGEANLKLSVNKEVVEFCKMNIDPLLLHEDYLEVDADALEQYSDTPEKSKATLSNLMYCYKNVLGLARIYSHLMQYVENDLRNMKLNTYLYEVVTPLLHLCVVFGNITRRFSWEALNSEAYNNWNQHKPSWILTMNQIAENINVAIFTCGNSCIAQRIYGKIVTIYVKQTIARSNFDNTTSHQAGNSLRYPNIQRQSFYLDYELSNDLYIAFSDFLTLIRNAIQYFITSNTYIEQYKSISGEDEERERKEEIDNKVSALNDFLKKVFTDFIPLVQKDLYYDSVGIKEKLERIKKSGENIYFSRYYSALIFERTISEVKTAMKITLDVNNGFLDHIIEQISAEVNDSKDNISEANDFFRDLLSTHLSRLKARLNSITYQTKICVEYSNLLTLLLSLPEKAEPGETSGGSRKNSRVTSQSLSLFLSDFSFLGQYPEPAHGSHFMELMRRSIYDRSYCSGPFGRLPGFRVKYKQTDYLLAFKDTELSKEANVLENLTSKSTLLKKELEYLSLENKLSKMDINFFIVERFTSNKASLNKYKSKRNIFTLEFITNYLDNKNNRLHPSYPLYLPYYTIPSDNWSGMRNKHLN